MTVKEQHDATRDTETKASGEAEDSKVQQQKGAVKEADPEPEDEALALAKQIVSFVRILHPHPHPHPLVQWP